MVAVGLLYVGIYGHNIPFYDEFSMVDMLTGGRHADLEWLWKPHNDHRIPVPKLILLALYKISGSDFRVGMYFTIFLLSAAAATLIIAARRARGRQSYADAFFPVILINWGHYENILWSWQVTQVIPVAVVLFLLALIVQRDARLSRGQTIGSGVAVAALPLCGVPGLAYVPALSLWLGFVGWRHWSAASGRRHLDAITAWGLGSAALILVPLYFAGLKPSVGALAGLPEILATMLAFISHGLGPAVLAVGPLAYFAVGFLLLISLALLLPALRAADGQMRSRAWAMVLFLGAFSTLALSVGVARPVNIWSGGDLFAPRYFLQAVPAWCWIYFVWDRFARGKAARPVKLGLALSALAAAGPNAKAGLDYARGRHGALLAFENDVRAGMAPSELLARHQRALMPFPEEGGRYGHDYLAGWMGKLRQSRAGIFAELGRERGFREIAAASVAVPDVRGGSAERRWTFKSPTFIHGVRFQRPRPLSACLSANPTVIVSWRRNENEGFSLDRRYVHWFEQEPGATFWLYDRVHEVRIEIDDSEGGFAVPDPLFLIAG